MAPPVYFIASFGDIPLFVTKIETERGGDVTVQSPATGNHHALTRRGGKLRRCTCEVLFINQPGLADYLTRYEAFAKAFEEHSTDIFTHPLDGSYRAQAESLTASAESGSLSVRATAVFLRDDETRSAFTSGGGVALGAGVEAVSAAAKDANVELDDLEVPTDLDEEREDGLKYEVLGDTVDTVDAWDELADGLDSNAVLLEMGSLSQRIDEAIEDLELVTSLDRWPAYEKMIVLRYELGRAAEAFTSEAETVIDVFVDEPRSLLDICVDLYGAGEAVERSDRATRDNRVRTPGLVPRGTRLKMPRPVNP